MIIIGAFTCFIYYYKKDNLELYFNSNKLFDDVFLVGILCLTNVPSISHIIVLGLVSII